MAAITPPPKRVSIIGFGRIGLAQGILWATRGGWDVLGCDISQAYCDAINDRSLRSAEPELEAMLRATPANMLRATTSLDEALAHAKLCFIVVATGCRRQKGYDLSTVRRLLCEINERRVGPNLHVVLSCTVLPNFIAKHARYLLRDCPGVVITYHPQTIAQGSIIRDLLRPAIVLIGASTEEAGDAIEQLVVAVAENEPKVHRMTPESMEIAKLSLNCFITMKIAFANMVGDVADATPGADKVAILACIGDDRRVGALGLRPGYGFGGSCFPRDNYALAAYLDEKHVDASLPRATDAANKFHAKNMTERVLAEAAAADAARGADADRADADRADADRAGASTAEKAGGGGCGGSRGDRFLRPLSRVANNIWLDVRQQPASVVMEGVTYKPGIPQIANSQPLAVAEAVARAGRRVVLRDRESVLKMVAMRFSDMFEYEHVAS